MSMPVILDYPVARGRTPPPVRPFYWICQAAGWAVFCSYVTLGYLYGTSGQWRRTDLLNIGFFSVIVCPAVSHGLRAWLWRRGWVDMPASKLVPRLVVLVIATAASLTTATITSLYVLNGPPWLDAIAAVSMTVGYAWFLGAWFVIYFAMKARHQHHEARAAARDAQLHALATQLNPHFLFNSLNSVRALIAEHPERAATMITAVADLLRYSLSSDRRHTVALAEELAIVDEYLALERVRFEERLRIERDVDPAALQAGVPPMLVQTLVENAVKHGIADSISGGVVRLRVAVTGARIEIEVENTGEFKPATGLGRGLRNATERLRLLYGSEASLDVRSSNGRTVVAVSVPRIGVS